MYIYNVVVVVHVSVDIYIVCTLIHDEMYNINSARETVVINLANWPPPENLRYALYIKNDVTVFI